MTRPAWEMLTPEQQRAEWERFNAWRSQPEPPAGRHAAPQPPTSVQAWVPPAGFVPYPPAPEPEVPPKTNVAAGIGLGAGILGLLVLPFLFGPVALICAAGGLDHAKKHAGVGRGAAIGALVLGAINLLIAVVVITARARYY